jgi:hypothetical protein
MGYLLVMERTTRFGDISSEAGPCRGKAPGGVLGAWPPAAEEKPHFARKFAQ